MGRDLQKVKVVSEDFPHSASELTSKTSMSESAVGLGAAVVE